MHHSREAYLRFQQGDAPGAAALCRRALEQDPADVEAIYLLGVIATEEGRLTDALAHFQNAVKLAPENGVIVNALGEACCSMSRELEAMQWFQRALAALPGYARAHNNLGRLLHARGDLAGARASFSEAVRLNPNYATAHNNLGAVLQAQGSASSLDHFRRALAIQPDYPEAHCNLGAALLASRDCAGAIAELQAAVRLRPDYVRAHAMLAEALEDMNRLPEALESYQRAAAHPGSFHGSLRLLESLGRRAEADERWQARLRDCPDDGARVRALLETPQIFQSAQDMRAQRRRLEEGLSFLEQRSLSIADPLRQVNSTNFFAAYHGVNDRDIQCRLARLYQRATPSLSYVAPHCRQPFGKPRSDVPRVGFVSAFFHMHTIGEVNLGIIQNLSRRSCRVILFPMPGPDDAVGKVIRQSADEVVELEPSLDAARRQIAGQKLDVLFYTDIGMDVFTYFLAFSRLAPVQCTTWGHPDTTGIPTIDYYLSSIDLEPPDADEHYSEKLVRLRGLPTYYYAPAFFPPAKPRAHFGLAEDEHLYLCSQAPFKVHPDYDAMLGEILRRDDRGRVFFISSQNPEWTHQLRRRMRRNLGREFDRIGFLPHQGGQDYLHLLNVCDVLLDTTHFGGGNTHLKAFSVGTPVVTLPGAFARSRVATACYRKMEISECVAADTEDYVRIAHRLGRDREWNQHIRERIKNARHVLFEDSGILRELEKFFAEVTGRSM